MRRREFIAGLGAVAWALPAQAQQSDRAKRIGVLMNVLATTETENLSYVTTFIQAMRELGWIEGRNIRVDVRWAAGDGERARTYATQLIGLMPDVILASGTTNLSVIRQANSVVPVVFVAVSDPVAQGFVASMSRPSGNITGFSTQEFSFGGKWLYLLKEVAPSLARVAVMFNPDTSPQSKFFMAAIRAAATPLDVQVVTEPVQATADIEPALANFARVRNGGLILTTDSFTALRYSQIAELAGRYGLPSIGPVSDFAKNGGLMHYGADVNLPGQFRGAATYVDRILKGSQPGELPVQGPDRYTFVINLKTAKALDVTIPETLLATADEVIQ